MGGGAESTVGGMTEGVCSTSGSGMAEPDNSTPPTPPHWPRSWPSAWWLLAGAVLVVSPSSTQMIDLPSAELQ